MRAVEFMRKMRDAGLKLAAHSEPQITIVLTGAGNEAIQEFVPTDVTAAPGRITILCERLN